MAKNARSTKKEAAFKSKLANEQKVPVNKNTVKMQNSGISGRHFKMSIPLARQAQLLTKKAKETARPQLSTLLNLGGMELTTKLSSIKEFRAKHLVESDGISLRLADVAKCWSLSEAKAGRNGAASFELYKSGDLHAKIHVQPSRGVITVGVIKDKKLPKKFRVVLTLVAEAAPPESARTDTAKLPAWCIRKLGNEPGFPKGAVGISFNPNGAPYGGSDSIETTIPQLFEDAPQDIEMRLNSLDVSLDGVSSDWSIVKIDAQAGGAINCYIIKNKDVRVAALSVAPNGYIGFFRMGRATEIPVTLRVKLIYLPRRKQEAAPRQQPMPLVYNHHFPANMCPCNVIDSAKSAGVELIPSEIDHSRGPLLKLENYQDKGWSLSKSGEDSRMIRYSLMFNDHHAGDAVFTREDLTVRLISVPYAPVPGDLVFSITIYRKHADEGKITEPAPVETAPEKAKPTSCAFIFPLGKTPKQLGRLKLSDVIITPDMVDYSCSPEVELYSGKEDGWEISKGKVYGDEIRFDLHRAGVHLATICYFRSTLQVVTKVEPFHYVPEHLSLKVTLHQKPAANEPIQAPELEGVQVVGKIDPVRVLGQLGTVPPADLIQWLAQNKCQIQVKGHPALPDHGWPDLVGPGVQQQQEKQPPAATDPNEIAEASIAALDALQKYEESISYMLEKFFVLDTLTGDAHTAAVNAKAQIQARLVRSFAEEHKLFPEVLGLGKLVDGPFEVKEALLRQEARSLTTLARHLGVQINLTPVGADGYHVRFRDMK